MLPQVATRDAVFLFDLLALHSQPALSDCLAHAWHSPDVTLLGFELAGDLAKLAASYPDLPAFRKATAVLDLKGLWLEWVTLAPPPVRAFFQLGCRFCHISCLKPCLAVYFVVLYV